MTLVLTFFSSQNSSHQLLLSLAMSPSWNSTSKESRHRIPQTSYDDIFFSIIGVPAGRQKLASQFVDQMESLLRDWNTIMDLEASEIRDLIRDLSGEMREGGNETVIAHKIADTALEILEVGYDLPFKHLFPLLNKLSFEASPTPYSMALEHVEYIRKRMYDSQNNFETLITQYLAGSLDFVIDDNPLSQKEAVAVQSNLHSLANGIKCLILSEYSIYVLKREALQYFVD